MKIKHLLVLTFLIAAIGCQDQNFIDNGPSIVSRGTLRNTAGSSLIAMPDLRVSSPETAYQALVSFNNTVKANPAAVINTSQGYEVTDYSQIAIPDGMQYMRDVHFANVGEQGMIPETKPQRRERIAGLLPTMKFSNTFNSIILNSVDYMMNLSDKSASDVLSKLDEYLLIASHGYGLNAYERFTLVQMFTNLKNITQDAINNPGPTSVANGRDPKGCKLTFEQWKEIVWEAMTFGLTVGSAASVVGWRIGWSITSAAGGNPVYGALAGGIIAFTGGFAAGAAAGGGTRLVYECLANAAITTQTAPKSYFCFHSKVIRSYTPLPGCMEINMSYPTDFTDYVTKRGMMQLKDMHIFANLGSNTINSEVEEKIKFILQRL